MIFFVLWEMAVDCISYYRHKTVYFILDFIKRCLIGTIYFEPVSFIKFGVVQFCKQCFFLNVCEIAVEVCKFAFVRPKPGRDNLSERIFSLHECGPLSSRSLSDVLLV